MSEQTEIRLRAAVWPLVGAVVATILTLAVWFHEHFASADDLQEVRSVAQAADKGSAVNGALLREMRADQQETKQIVKDLLDRLTNYPIERHR